MEEIEVLAGKMVTSLGHGVCGVAAVVLSFLYFGPGAWFILGKAFSRNVEPSPASGAFLRTDLETYGTLLPVVLALDENRPRKITRPDKGERNDSPLNRWEKLEPQALRYSYSFDYYLGFSY